MTTYIAEREMSASACTRSVRGIALLILLCLQIIQISKLAPPHTTCLTFKQSVVGNAFRVTPYQYFHHGLRGSASPVLIAIGFVNGKNKFLTPSTWLNWWPKNCHRLLYRRLLQLCQIWCKFVHGELMRKWVKCNVFLHLPICFFSENDPSADFCPWSLKRRGITQGCALLGSRWY